MGLTDNEPWFVGKDVAEALGYADTKSALADHVDADDKQIVQRGQITTLDIPNRGLTIINESGLYSLVMSSKLPGPFKKDRVSLHILIKKNRSCTNRGCRCLACHVRNEKCAISCY